MLGIPKPTGDNARPLVAAIACVALLMPVGFLDGQARWVAVGVVVAVAFLAVLVLPRRATLHDRVDEIAESVAREQPVAATASPIVELERLTNLRDRGALTDEEFQEQKRKLLG